MPASLDARKKKTAEASSCDESSVCSEEICCVFDNNVEEQERKIQSILKKFDQCHEDRLYYIEKCLETEEQLKKQKKETNKIEKEVLRLQQENQTLKDKIINLVKA